jgi:hypothetical protein
MAVKLSVEVEDEGRAGLLFADIGWRMEIMRLTSWKMIYDGLRERIDERTQPQGVNRVQILWGVFFFLITSIFQLVRNIKYDGRAGQGRYYSIWGLQ